jgi:hypothetical protein
MIENAFQEADKAWPKHRGMKHLGFYQYYTCIKERQKMERCQ